MSARSFRRRASVALPLAGLLAVLPAAPGTAQTTTVAIDAQAGAGYSTNPFLVSGGDEGSAYADILIQPELLYRDERGEAALSARYSRTEYARRYDAADSYGALLRASRQVSQVLSVRGSLAYDSSILGQGAFGTIGVVDPTTPPLPGTPDITLLGLRQRQKSIIASVGADWRLSARDSANTDVSVSKVDYGGLDVLTSSRTISAGAGYSRTLSERTSVGLQGLGSWVDFRRRGYSGSFYQPQLTLNRQVSETLRFKLAAGLIFVSSTTDQGTRRTTGFSGSFDGCDQRQRSTTCLRAYSDAQATGLGDVSRRIGGALDHSYVLNENDILRGSVAYSRVNETSRLIQVPSANYVNADLGYEHRFSRRFSGGASAGYRHAGGSGIDRPSDLNFKIFVRTRLGDDR